MKTFLIWISRPSSTYGILFLTLVILTMSLISRIRKYNRVGVELTRAIYALESELSSEKLWKKRNHWITREIPLLPTRTKQRAVSWKHWPAPSPIIPWIWNSGSSFHPPVNT